MLEERIEYNGKHFVRFHYEDYMPEIELIKYFAEKAIDKVFNFYECDIGHIHIYFKEKEGFEKKNNEIYLGNVSYTSLVKNLSYLFETKFCLNEIEGKISTAWLSEGLAAYLANYEGEFDQIPDNFLKTSHNDTTDYSVSKSAFEFLLSKGKKKVLKYIENRNPINEDYDSANKRFKKVFGLTMEDFENKWKQDFYSNLKQNH